ncbi:hypothetical protein H7K14_20235 [Mycolicibacter longobardus]|uniref:hypothetical protein n=1 Tax=Mycolicibacter longobardus TaxID=1108812 RepID=UPI0021F35579|nr:hypothetical protein [Mycolicibacter longobardus]MCV7386144.1 hypothetical protein [Mycolicibacter longobardus]
MTSPVLQVTPAGLRELAQRCHALAVQVSPTAAAALLLASLSMASCTPHTHDSHGGEAALGTIATKNAPNPLRHDSEPLTKRFPRLGSPVTTSWVSGDMGDPRVPGPSTYWLDCIVELAPATIADLKARYRPAPTTVHPDVSGTLAGVLPAGSYLASGALDEAFSSTSISSTVFLAEQAPVIVISALGH